jgi:hypothetical protein
MISPVLLSLPWPPWVLARMTPASIALLEVVLHQRSESAHADLVGEHRVGRARCLDGGENVGPQRLARPRRSAGSRRSSAAWPAPFHRHCARWSAPPGRAVRGRFPAASRPAGARNNAAASWPWVNWTGSSQTIGWSGSAVCATALSISRTTGRASPPMFRRAPAALNRSQRSSWDSRRMKTGSASACFMRPSVSQAPWATRTSLPFGQRHQAGAPAPPVRASGQLLGGPTADDRRPVAQSGDQFARAHGLAVQVEAAGRDGLGHVLVAEPVRLVGVLAGDVERLQRQRIGEYVRGRRAQAVVAALAVVGVVVRPAGAVLLAAVVGERSIAPPHQVEVPGEASLKKAAAARGPPVFAPRAPHR